jgi:hypothetical protein
MISTKPPIGEGIRDELEWTFSDGMPSDLSRNQDKHENDSSAEVDMFDPSKK